MENKDPLNKIRSNSWEKMATILDQEMPVERKRRKPLVFWFLGLGFFALISGILIVKEFNFQIHDSLPNTSRPNTPKSNTNCVIPNNVMVQNETKLSKIYYGKGSTNPLLHNTKEVKHQPNQIVSTLVSDDMANKAKNIQPVVAANENDINILNFNDVNENNGILGITSQESNYFDNSPPRIVNDESFGAIPTLEPQSIVSQSSTVISLLNIIPSKSEPIVNYGIKIGLASFDLKKMSNYFVGGQITKRINKSWSLTGHIGLRNYIRNNYYLQSSNLTLQDKSGSINFSKQYTTETLNFLNSAINSTLTSKIYYGECQIAARYSPFKNFFVSGGISASRLVYQKNSTTNATNEIISDIEENTTSNNVLTDSQLVLNTSDLYKKWLFNGVLGIEYDLASHFSIYSNVNYLFTNDPKDVKPVTDPVGAGIFLPMFNEKIDKKYFMELGVKYNFK